ncbi:MAG TPA: transglycosylase SLT domain-containing protein [Thermoanaerobaculia bacterium]|jgi:membrane-bound lytic murein transglycosylase D
MRRRGACRGGLFALGALTALALSLAPGCASSASSRASAAAQPAARPASAEELAQTRATSEFELGRDAALAGDFECARGHFQSAVDAVRPAGAPPATGPMQAFSLDLYESIQRYEALAGATEEAGTSHGEVAPELAELEAPEATEAEITTAREAVASEPTISSDVPIVVNDAVLRVIAAFQSPALHDKIEAGLGRSGRYVPMIQRIFAEAGLPQDLAWIAFIESSFLPHARSNKAAHGIWQFMPRTGREYGLKSNGIIDERRDPEKATRAAATYLAYLHELFDDWYLAMAAYNAGEGKIMRGIQRTGARDFWQLAANRSAIRKQTKNYVPAFLASVLISKNPSHYGFDVNLAPPLEYDTVVLDRPISLDHLAAGAQLTLDDLQDLNPELRLPVTPTQPEGYTLKVPAGSHDAVLAAYADAPTAKPPTFKTYVAKKGDTLPRIAKRHGVSVAALASANSLSTRSRVARGQEIMIPEKVASASTRKSTAATTGKPTKKKSSPTKIAQASTEKPKTATSKAAPSQKNYRVRSGDTLYRIAVDHGVTVAEILAINSVGGVSIHPGDLLKIPPKK